MDQSELNRRRYPPTSACVRLAATMIVLGGCGDAAEPAATNARVETNEREPVVNGGAGAESIGGNDNAVSTGGVSAGSTGGNANAVSTGGRGGASAVSPAGNSNAIAVLYEQEREPHSVAVDERNLYWGSLKGLRRAPLSADEPPVTLTTGSFRHILPAGEYVYFTEGARRIARVPRGGGEIEPIADATYPAGLAISDGALYWADPGNSTTTGKLMRAALDGSGVTELAAGLSHPGALAVHGELLYFTSTGEGCTSSMGASGGVSSACWGGGVWQLPKAGGTAVRVHDTSASGAIVDTEHGLYWPALSPPRVMFAAHGAIEREVAGVLDGIGDLHSDGRALYWAAGDRVLSMLFDDNQVVRLVTELKQADSVAVRGPWAYVAESGRDRILRVATDGSGNRLDGPITGPCPTPVGSAEELALTPRADENLELLALSLEPGGVTVSSETYERVVTDVAAVRALVPKLSDIGYFAPHDGKTLFVELTDLAAQALAAGQYSAWDCLNQAYGLTKIAPLKSFSRTYVEIELHGIYNIEHIGEVYAELPGLRSAGPSGRGGDASTLCAGREGARYEYVVDLASGDCPAGCTEHEARYFTSDSAGGVEQLGIWNSQDGAAAPEWFTRLCRH